MKNDNLMHLLIVLCLIILAVVIGLLVVAVAAMWLEPFAGLEF